MTRQRLSWALTASMLVLSVAIVIFAFYPGFTNPDTNQTWFQAQDAHYVLDWWTPFGSFVLRAWFRLGLGLGPVFIVQTAIFVAGAWLLARHVLPAVWAAAAALVVTAWPPTYSQLSEISRDVFFMGFALVALGALGAAHREPAEQTRRCRAWLAVALIAAVASYLSRQNGIVVVIGVVLGGLPLVIGQRIAALTRWRRVGGALAVGVLTGLVAFGLNTAGNRALGVRAVHPERMLYLYDLASISKLSGHNQFPAALVRGHRTGWVTPHVDQRTIERDFNWVNVISILPATDGPIDYPNTAIAKAEVDQLMPAWRHAITQEPLDYLWGRLRLTASTLGITQHPTNAYYGLLEPTNYGRPPEFFHGVIWASDYIRPFVGPLASIPLDIHWPYLLLSIGFTVFLWRRRPGDRALLLAIAIAQWLNIVVDFFVAPASSYSYADLTVPLALTLAAWTVWEAAIGGRSAPTADVDR